MRYQLSDNGITLEAVAHGRDLNVSIYGGDKPHIGAVAVAQARPSLRDPERISASTSVLTICGHKEDRLAYAVAERIASAVNGVVCVACGIHVTDADSEQITMISATVVKLAKLLIEEMQ